MTQENRSANRSVPPEVAQCLDKVCDRFEADWKAGWRPRIEDFLGDMAEPERSVLLHDLVLLELEIRHRNGESPKLDRYVKRFPDHRSLMEEVFKESAGPAADRPNRDALRTFVTEPVETEGAPSVPVKPARATSRRQLGRFELAEVVGEGAFGTVYRARDPHLDRDVAIKVPRSGVLVEDQDVARFLREAKASAQLRHPNIVAVYEAGRADHTYFIASAFVQGTTLRQAIKEGHKFSHEKVAKMVSQLASALHYAHTKGVIHRDVKPGNIMLDEQGESHIMDFGLARRTEGDALRTMEGVRLGTPAYMSPEQAQGQSHLADARTDVWSLGVILYELLTGKRPFEGSETEVLLAVRVKDPDPLRRLDRSILRDLETICLKCLAKDRKDRYASAQRVAEELDRWLRGEPIQARPIGIGERTWRWARRNPVVAGLGSVVAALVLTVAIVSSVSSYQLNNGRRELAKALADANEKTRLTQEYADNQRSLVLELEAEKTARAVEREKRKQAEVATESEKQARSDTELLNAGLEKEISTATSKAHKAEKARDQLLESSSFSQYADTIVQAAIAWRSGDNERALKFLGETASDQRSWEYHCLNWILHNGREQIWTKRLTAEVACISFSPDGHRLAVGLRLNETQELPRAAKNRLKTLQLLDSETGEEAALFDEEIPEVFATMFNDPGDQLASLGIDHHVKFWDVATGKRIPNRKSDIGSAVIGIVKNDAGQVLATSREAPTGFRISDPLGVSNSVELREVPMAGIQSMALSPDGLTLAISSAVTTNRTVHWSKKNVPRIGETYLFNLVGGSKPRTVLYGSAKCLVFSPDSHLLAGAGIGSTRVWHSKSGAPVLELVEPRGSVNSVGFSVDGRRIATGNADGSVGIWDAATGRRLLTFSGREYATIPAGKGRVTLPEVRINAKQDNVAGRINCLAFSPDGKKLVVAGSGGAVMLGYE